MLTAAEAKERAQMSGPGRGFSSSPKVAARRRIMKIALDYMGGAAITKSEMKRAKEQYYGTRNLASKATDIYRKVTGK